MKCRKCSSKAVINMRQHKLALCSSHYLEWIPAQTQRFIKKYDMLSHEDRILVAVSGGKDSLALWEILSELGYKADGLYIDLGIDGGRDYSDHSHRKAIDFAKQRNLHLIVVDVIQQQGASITEAADLTFRGRGKPCSICGLTKRHIMNRVALEEGYDILATGHNLDDEAATLFGNTIQWQVGYLAKQGPVLPGDPDGFVRKVKPLFRFYERETAAYALLKNIDYIHDECPHAIGASSIYYKELLNRMEEERPGTKLQFFLAYLRAKEEGLFSEEGAAKDLALSTCNSCGQPTSAPEMCSFCRMWDRVRYRKTALPT